MKFKELIEGNKFSLVVSLPSNNLELAEAALDGGAQAVKFIVMYGTGQVVIPLEPMRRTGSFCSS